MTRDDDEDVIDLGTFRQRVHTEINAMVGTWASKHVRDPDQWPIELPSGEWWEHFMTFDWTNGEPA